MLKDLKRRNIRNDTFKLKTLSLLIPRKKSTCPNNKSTQCLMMRVQKKSSIFRSFRRIWEMTLESIFSNRYSSRYKMKLIFWEQRRNRRSIRLGHHSSRLLLAIERRSIHIIIMEMISGSTDNLTVKLNFWVIKTNRNFYTIWRQCQKWRRERQRTENSNSYFSIPPTKCGTKTSVIGKWTIRRILFRDFELRECGGRTRGLT